MATRVVQLRDTIASPSALTLKLFARGEGATATAAFSGASTVTDDVHSWSLVDLAAGNYDVVILSGSTRVWTGNYTHADAGETVQLVDCGVVETALPGLVLTKQMTESYAANGVPPTLSEAIFAIHQMLMSFGISGTNWTVKKLDNTTNAFVVTLNDATNPTSVSRS